MSRIFSVEDAKRGTGQLCITASDMSQLECRLLRWIVCNNLMTHPDYQNKRDANPFLQGYEEPHPGDNDGWVKVEFWCDDRAAIDKYVAYVNAQFVDQERLKIMRDMMKRDV